ncbi:MAG: hypothetical protein H6Q10_2962, partial [Acidobacteria bacterium]|nr:hypothetical protein [Acidobacteriota bacterium]
PGFTPLRPQRVLQQDRRGRTRLTPRLVRAVLLAAIVVAPACCHPPAVLRKAEWATARTFQPPHLAQDVVYECRTR